jgi:nucleoside-diphosphate-sugar epimerase
MSENGGIHVVIGTSGGLGAAVVRVLRARGLPVRAVNRSGRGHTGEGVQWVPARLTKLESLAKGPLSSTTARMRPTRIGRISSLR